MFIALHNTLQQATAENTIDILETVSKLRHQRMKMIQTEVCIHEPHLASLFITLWSPQEQYILLHNAVLEKLFCGRSHMSPTDLMVRVARLADRNTALDITGFESQYKVRHHW